MKELSVFIDEAGSYGKYEPHSPFYLVTLVFHDQSNDITQNISKLNNRMKQCGLPGYTVHAGPLIRREDEYRDLLIQERKSIFDMLFHFIRMTDITYHAIIVEKKHIESDLDLTIQITKKLSGFLYENIESFLNYDRVVVYYDYGQRELTSIIATMFNTLLGNVEFRKVRPADYKLFQAADMFCTFELLALKLQRKALSQSELYFFETERKLHRDYLRIVRKKRF